MASGRGVNVYFPHDLIEKLESAGIDNVSAICQDAIRAEIEKKTKKCTRCGADLPQDVPL